MSKSFASLLLVLVTIAGSAVLGGCSTSVSPATIQAKAASDFSCAASDVKVTQVNDGNWKAAGCGKEASYVCSGSNFMSSGMCMREGDLPKR
jgi:hypothetical protein